jgi:hypothetical protein
MDYDFITTCNWTATGIYTLRAYRGSFTDVVTTHYASIFYRKKGTSTWTPLNSSGQMVVDSTGEWEVANNWNKSGNDCLTHSYLGITAIDSCTDVYFNEATLGTTIGNYFLYQCWYNCTSLSSMPAGFNLPTGITSVGDSFLQSCWYGCTSLTSMPSGFNLPTGITSVGSYFLYGCWRNCTYLSSMPSGFNLPSEITSVGNSFLANCWHGCTSLSSMPSGFNLPSEITSVGYWFLDFCWYNCTSLKADGYTENIDFKYAASNAFGGTCPITPDSPTAGSSVAVNRPTVSIVTTSAATNIDKESFTGNGNITDTGGENCTRRGFCYIAGTSGDPTTSDSVAYDDGSFGTGAFTKSITGLTAGTSYRVRAYAVNSAGTGYGTTVDVTTLKAFKPRTMWFN